MLNYTEYVASQRAKTDSARLWMQWVTNGTLSLLASYITQHLSLNTSFALAHGVRTGREAVWLRRYLPREQVWGTELSPLAAHHAPWTLAWDFHDRRAEWVGAADFVYSNSLDHAYNATLALQRWVEQTAPGGAVLVHWAGGSRPATGIHTKTDIYHASTASLVRTFCSVASLDRVLHLPRPRANWYGGRGQKQVVYVLRRRTDARSLNQCR